jgi:uncharacterized protein
MSPTVHRPAKAAGTISLTAPGTPYTQNFDTLATTGTRNTTLPTGWDLSESGTSTRNNGAYAADNGSSNTSDTYSYGATGNGERAFGTLRSGTLVPIVGAQFMNNTGATITSLSIAYTGEQWRLGAAARGSDRLDFQLSANATSLTTGTWTDYDSLDFSSPVTTGTVGARDGNAAANRTAMSFTITGLSIANGSTFWIRWLDFDATSADDGLAVDDFSLTPNGTVADTAPTVSSTTPANSAVNVARDANITINFSEAVTVTGAWFTIACATSGTHTAAVSGGPTSFTLDPDTNFAANELCTVTIIASQVTNQDTNAPPDNMVANYVFSFTTVDVQLCSAPATFIHSIQGNNLLSPMNGATNVVIEGVVVGDYQASNQFSGFFVQEEDADADADPATPEGIFVFNSSFSVNIGDKVRVKGNVSEFETNSGSGVFLTELTSVSGVTVCSSGNSVTAATVTLPVSSLTDCWTERSRYLARGLYG